MHYEDKIYDITALEMFKRLEVFFTEVGVPEFRRITVGGINRKSPLKFSEKIGEFKSRYAEHKAMPDIARLMTLINGVRNDIVHPHDLKRLVDFSIEPVVVLGRLTDFERFRDKCIQLENLLHKPPFEKHTGMSEIMIPTLKYEMGNLGDIIKHGLLAEFTDWHARGNARMVVADTFAGCPWGGNPRIVKRMENLAQASGGKAALIRAYTQGKAGWEKYPRYLGSGHLVARIGENHDKKITVLASDRDVNARANLLASGLGVINLPNDNDGFSILDDAVFDKHRPNMILLDPYGEFLREEFHAQFGKLRKIARLTESKPSLWVALFVLDMYPEIGRKRRQTVQETHDLYAVFRDTLFRNKAVYLRCPKAKESYIKGEKQYDAEIVLISEQLRNKNNPQIRDLLNRLRKFSQTATTAFEQEAGLLLTGDKKVEYREV